MHIAREKIPAMFMGVCVAEPLVLERQREYYLEGVEGIMEAGHVISRSLICFTTTLSLNP